MTKSLRQLVPTQIPGFLGWDPKNAELVLLGAPEACTQLFTLHGPQIMLGIDTEGRAITLHDLFGIPSPALGSVPRNVYHANLVLIGDHFQRSADIEFHTVFVHFTNLDVWAGKPSVSS